MARQHKLNKIDDDRQFEMIMPQKQFSDICIDFSGHNSQNLCSLKRIIAFHRYYWFLTLGLSVCLWSLKFLLNVSEIELRKSHAALRLTLRAKLSGAVYCYRSCLCVCVFATGGRAVSEPYYNQRARSVCVSLSVFSFSICMNLIWYDYCASWTLSVVCVM